MFCIQKRKTFSLMTSLNKTLTLTDPHKFLENKMFFSRIKNVKQIKKQWYYVHFTNNNYQDILKEINVKTSDEIFKDTFVLFLTQDQLNYISNMSLVKNIEPAEKYYEFGGNIDDVENLYVTTFHEYKLTNHDNLFTIEKQILNNYVIKFNIKNLPKKEIHKTKTKTVKILSEIPEIKFISTYKRPTAKNSLATGFTQKNSFNFIPNEFWKFYSLDRYLNNRELRGENQIITIMDTILDFNHAMFRDDEVPIELNTTMENHRKIIYYKYHGSIEDWKKEIEQNEHGTHVAGTAAGKSLCPNLNQYHYINEMDGNAPEAKILYAGHFNQFDENLFKLMEMHGSTISSNSWGTDGHALYLNQEAGELLYKYPEIVFIVAAGNEYEVLNGNFSVGDPGGSKNALTVGAIANFYIDKPIWYCICSLNDANKKYDIKLLIGKELYNEGTIGFVPGKSDILAVDLSKGNQCHIIEKEGIYLFYGDTSNNWISNCTVSENVQWFYIYENDMMELSKVGGKVKMVKLNNIKEKNDIKRADYSSTGPGFKGILKPDVMAPGTGIISAKSLSNSNSPHGCNENIYKNYAFMKGTSMATPNIAGAMALVHQYFNSGKWIEKVKIDGATSRALMINSCRHPKNEKMPDIIYGHGVVDLSTIIPIENDFGVQMTKHGEISSNTHSVKQNGHVISKFKVNKNINKKLQITLSYIDPMLSIESYIPITRDLDMIVISPSKKIYQGDHLSNGDTQHTSTNEKVIIDENDVEDGVYTIHIFGGVFADGSLNRENLIQKFAVVASGPIENGFLEFTETNECLCDKCDPNRPGYCLCDANKIGQMCQIDIETINENHGEFTVGPFQVKRIRFVSNKKIKSVRSMSSYPGKYATIWASKECHLSLGEYESIGITGTSPEATNVESNKEVCVAIFNNNDQNATYVIEVSNKKKINWILILIIVIPIVVLILIIIGIVICCIKKPCRAKANKYQKENLNPDISENMI